MVEGFFQSSETRSGILIGLEGVDTKQIGLQGLQAHQQEVHDYLEIRTCLGNDLHQDDPVDASEGMVGNGDKRPACRDVLQVLFGNVVVYFECLQRLLKELRRWQVPEARIAFVQAVEF